MDKLIGDADQICGYGFSSTYLGNKAPNVSNNYKVYSAVDLQRLKMIKHAKMLGFTLSEIADVLTVWIEDEFSVAQKRACLERKLIQIEEKELALKELRAGINNALFKVGLPCDDAF
ncbi:MerR family DNA-binding protein [Shewanella baltica]|uniref:MerR family DNA-binding protein n=1 Tax=Shewanella baltica TaxID=62322 RepID=UPI000054FB96|nr:MerR family DNA-binding protein [Shewanella baltica]AEH13794.1 Transcription regulator MerR DNA binding protein [Shewanella baltica OS117]